MLEGLKTFFTDRSEVLDAKRQLRRLEAKRRLSETDLDVMEEAQRVVRRDHLTRDAKVAVASLIGFGSLSLLNLDRLLTVVNSLRRSPDSQAIGISEAANKPEQKPDNLAALRQEMIDFEEKVSQRPIIDQDIVQLFGFTDRLYKAVFSRPTIQGTVFVIGNEIWQQQNQRIDWPIIEGVSLKDIQINLPPNTPIPARHFSVIRGRSDRVDPKISPISAYRGLIFHAYLHTQFIPRGENRVVNINERQFPISEVRGLKYMAQGDQGLFDVAQFFEEANVQLMAEHLNDALGKDRIYQQMTESLFYQNSLPPIYTRGAGMLKKLYDRLGISIYEVETYHYSSNPKALLDKIDAQSSRLGINLPQPVSTILTSLNPQNPKSYAELTPLEELVSKHLF